MRKSIQKTFNRLYVTVRNIVNDKPEPGMLENCFGANVENSRNTTVGDKRKMDTELEDLHFPGSIVAILLKGLCHNR